MNIVDAYGDVNKITGELTPSRVLVQSFTANNAYLTSISVNFATYMRRNDCTITFEIHDSVTEECLFKQPYSAMLFRDNAYFNFQIKIDLILGRKYDLVIYSNGTPGNAITAKFGYKKHIDEKFMIGDELITGELACMFEYSVADAVSTPSSNVYNQGMISIIIPVYNSAKYLGALLDSIKKQSYNFYEIIVVDDGSENHLEVEDVIKKYEDLKIKSLRLPTNKGACYARNSGATVATGEFLFFCDSDVILDPSILSNMVQKLHNNPTCDWAYCNFTVGNDRRKFCQFNIAEMKKRNICSTMSLIRHSVNPLFDNNLKRLQDWDMFLTLIEKGKQGVLVDSFLFTAIDRPGITKNSISWEEAVSHLKKKHKMLH